MNKNMPPSELLESGSCFEQKFDPVVRTSGWQVAVLRQCGKVFPDCIQQVERHNETDEIFILTTGKANLIIVGEEEGMLVPWVIPMGINVVYTIKKAVWHHVVMSADAHIFIFEKEDTSRANSDYLDLDEITQHEIRNQLRW